MARRGRVKVGPSAAPQIGEDLEDVLVDAREMADDDEVVELEEAVVEPEEDGEREDAEDAEAEEAEVAAAAIEAELEREARAATGEDALLDVLLRTTGVLPDEPETIAIDEEDELPSARRADEFVCSSCFLIKARGQLADAGRRLCRDCVDAPDLAATRRRAPHAA